MVYSKGQLEQAWVANGGKPAAAATAAAIALAESKGNREPYGDKGLGAPGYTSFGPYQIHVTAHPEYSPQLLVDNLNYSTKAAIKISNNGTDFSPWTTFKTGAYTSYLTGGSAGSTANASLLSEIPEWGLKGPQKFGEALGNEIFGGPGPGLPGVPGLGGIGGALSATEIIAEWLADPLRIVKLVGGGVITYLGLKTLTRGTAAAPVVEAPGKAVSLARRAGEKAAEIGAVA